MSEQPSDPAAGVFPEVQGLRLLHELGRSPKGITYKARRLVEQDVVAAKILRRSRCEKRFLSELPRKAESTFVLEHKGLVRSLGCVEGMERLVLLMDYAPGDALAKLLRPGEPLLLSRALLSALQCVNALRYASLHQLYHGRLHPADVLLGEDHVRITGVGLGQRPEHAAWAEAEAPPFEPLIYTAPEAMPSKPFPESPVAQAAVDIYSLGAILFHTLTGAPPFRSVDEGALVNERKLLATAVVWPGQRKAVLPAELIALVEEMLAGE
ncbi:MAG: protein kinase, partial [Planctomycetota bacterium]